MSEIPAGTTFGHPRGLYVLFFTEMWERFSFYGMKALLIFYLTEHFLFGDDVSAGVVGTYGSMVYLAPVLGGWVADRFLGFRKAVMFGAVLLCVGHLLMAFEGTPAERLGGDVIRDETAVQIMYLALAFIVAGVGFLKPSISTIVGQLYEENDDRRDQGFTIFYMGINLGALVAILLCGYLGQTYGWKYGFGLAGIGMLTGLATFIRGGRHFGDAGLPPDVAELNSRRAGLTIERWLYIGGVASIAAVWWLMQYQALVGALLGFVAFVAVAGIIGYAWIQCAPRERNRVFVVLILTLVSVVFWTLFEQAATSMTLFTDRNVHKNMLGFEMQASQLGFLNPGFIILLALPFAAVWNALGGRGREPSTPMKFGLGVVQAGVGFLMLVIGAGFADEAGQVALGWLVLAYFFHTTGELCLSPTGLSMVTKFTPARILGLMMGVWFLASAGAHYVAGLVAGQAAIDSSQPIDATASLPVYTDVFNTLGWVGIGVGLGVMALTPLLKGLSHESQPGEDESPAAAQGVVRDAS